MNQESAESLLSALRSELEAAAEIDRVFEIPGIEQALFRINQALLATRPRVEVTLTTTERLRPMIPSTITVVAESGIFTAADVRRLANANVDAILVGEALVTSDDIPAKVRELSGMNL